MSSVNSSTENKFKTWAQVFTKDSHSYVFFRVDCSPCHRMRYPHGKTDLDMTRDYLHQEYDLDLEGYEQSERVVTDEEVQAIKNDKSYTVLY